jgi:predicted DNA-binding transcriptional regulator AlpA
VKKRKPGRAPPSKKGARAAFYKAPASQQVTEARRATNVPTKLLSRHDVIAITGYTYPTIWKMMTEGRFPRSRIAGHSTRHSSKSVWLSSEVEQWMRQLPRRPLKGDTAPGEGEE